MTPLTVFSVGGVVSVDKRLDLKINDHVPPKISGREGAGPVKAKTINGILVMASTALIGCSTPFEPSLRTEKITDNAIISGTPSLSRYTVKQRNDGKVVCLGRGSDATFEQSESGDFSIAPFSTGGTDAGGESESTGEQEMAGRTPSVLMAREIFYRVCELSSNYNLDKKEALALFKQALEKVSKNWLKETENTTVTIGDQVITKATTDRSDKVINSMVDKIITSKSEKDSSSKIEK